MKRLDRDCLLQLAGERAFLRGEEYFLWGRVRGLTSDGKQAAAFVDGARSYRVGIRSNDGRSGWECACPEGVKGRFCKHCVAVALAWLNDGQDGNASGQEVRRYLTELAPRQLLELVLEQASRDARFGERLRLRAARCAGTEPDLGEQRRLLEYATEAADAAEEVTAVSAIVAEVESALSQLLEEGFAEQAASLIEDAPIFLRSNQTEAGESLLEALLARHRESCRRAAIPAASLAQRLLAWQLRCPVLARSEVTERYSDLFGRQGWKAYRRLAQTEWDGVHANGSPRTPEQRERYRCLAALMESLAKQRRDTAALIAIKGRSLKDADDYLEIARLCKRRGDRELALQWARRGADCFAAAEAGELYEFLAGEYQTSGEWREALAILFARFRAWPSLRGYQKIADCARQAGEWAEWRERVLDVLQRTDDGGDISPATHSPAADQSTLVGILLFENEDEAAWQAARQGECSDDLWQEIARRRARTHPEDALRIFKQLVERFASRKNRYSYAAAVETLRGIKLLLKRQHREEEFIPYVEGLCRTHRAQHSLVKMLRALMARHSPGKHGVGR